jgi:hypothetical protein
MWFNANLSSPMGTTSWARGSPVKGFDAQSGPTDSYTAASVTSTTGTGTISDWLFTPVMTFRNGNAFRFYTRAMTGSTHPDRLQVRLSTNLGSTNVGATAESVGDFTILLADINPTLQPTGYPRFWTPYTVIVRGLTGLNSGRIAFRYYVTNGGPDGTNSDYIGVDTVSMCSIQTISMPVVMR